MPVLLAPRSGLFTLATLVVALSGCAAPPPVPAPTPATSEKRLDAALQAAAERAVKSTARAAAVVALDPETGAVQALYSVPGERGDPLLRADVPASTFKTFAAIAGLEAGILTESTTLDCTGTYQFGDKTLHCNKAHGHENTAESISRSCNSFYFRAATQMDPTKTLEVARRFGFGERTGIELADQPGSVPTDARARQLQADPKNPAALMNAIGHGEITVTLLQLGRAFAVLANGGKLLRLSVTGQQGVERTVPLKPEHLALVRGALVDTVASADGTAHDLADPAFPFAGKTGTSDAPPRPRDHDHDHDHDHDDTEAEPDLTDTLFIAYSPPDHPRILVGARVEYSDDTHDAKRTVKAVLDAWRAAHPSPQ